MIQLKVQASYFDGDSIHIRTAPIIVRVSKNDKNETQTTLCLMDDTRQLCPLRTYWLMALHKEISFEDEICQCLQMQGWFYSENDSGYNRNIMPPGFAWQKGVWFQDSPTSFLQVDEIYVDAHGNVEVLFIETYASNRSLEHDAMFEECGWLTVPPS